MRSFTICMVRQVELEWSSQGGWDGQSMWHAWGRSAYKILVRKPEVKRPLGRPRRTWENNIRMDLREIRWGGMEWIDLAQDRGQWRALVNMVMKLWVPQKILRNCWVAAQLAASQKGIGSMELVSQTGTRVLSFHGGKNIIYRAEDKSKLNGCILL
jgi:hypothetical protein